MTHLYPVTIEDPPGTHRIIGPTILLGSGTYFDFESPETSEITIEDIAYGLAAASRFAGQCVYRGRRVRYSVAQHCVLMSRFVPLHLPYSALMHELGEAPCGDMTGPLKQLCRDYKRVEKRCAHAIEARFGVTMDHPLELKHWDLRMLATERRDLMPATHAEWSSLPPPIEGLHITPWEFDTAAVAFLHRYRELKPGVPRHE